MGPPTDPALKIQGRIVRRSERIARWDTEADRVELSWCGGLEYRRFCQGMAGDNRQKKQELEAELQRLAEGRTGLALEPEHPGIDRWHEDGGQD